MSYTPKAAIVTGSSGLIGAETCRRLVAEGYRVHGVDNDLRRLFFGADGSTASSGRQLVEDLRARFEWHQIDIRDENRVTALYRAVRPELVVHLASQPSHDRAAKDPRLDFTVNANGTLNMLEAHRRWVPDSTFVFTSSSKVFGTHPNELPLVEHSTRYDLPETHEFYDGITTNMSVDQTMHSLFGASKLSADVMCQEYARYFQIPIGVWRPGCLTGANHSAVEMHGFLNYLGKCVTQGLKYRMYGYKGKQVRDNISARDLVSTFVEYHKNPKIGSVYTVGGGRQNSCSILEAIAAFERISGKAMPSENLEYVDQARVGDHIWFIGSGASFEEDYPSWRLTDTLDDLYHEIVDRYRV